MLKRAEEFELAWPLTDDMTNAALEKLLFPKVSQIPSDRMMPDYEYVRKELLRNGVSKKLLWTEYMEKCRQASKTPLKYSQFCYYIQQDEENHQATMQINRKPGEQTEVD